MFDVVAPFVDAVGTAGGVAFSVIVAASLVKDYAVPTVRAYMELRREGRS